MKAIRRDKMQKKWILKLCFILCFIILLPFSFCFASENEKENEEATKKQLLLVIDECVNDIKNETSRSTLNDTPV